MACGLFLIPSRFCNMCVPLGWCKNRPGGPREEATQLPKDLRHSLGMWPAFSQLLGGLKVTGPGNLILLQMAFPWPGKLCGEHSGRYLAPGLSKAISRGCLSPGAPPFSAPEVQSTGQLRPFPEILSFLLLILLYPQMKN